MSVYLYIINIYYAILDLVFFMCAFDSKYNKWKSSIFYLSYNAILIYIGLFSEIANNISSFAIIISMFIYVMLAFKDKNSEKITGFWIYYAVTVMVDYLSYAIGSLLIDGEIHLFCTYIFAVLKPIMVIYFLYIWKNVKKYGIGKRSLVFILLPLLQSAACQFMISFTKTAATHKEYRDTLDAVFNSDKKITFASVAVMVLFIVIDALVFKGFIDNLEMTKTQAQLQVFEYQNEINYKYYSEIKENAIELKKIRHDLNNILQIIQGLVYDEYNHESPQIKALFEGLKSRTEKLNVVSFCPDELINALISAKKSECDQLNIEFEPTIFISSEMHIEEIDLFRCVCNMLDNAIEAQQLLSSDKKRYVYFTMKSEKNTLYISTKNSITENLKIEKKMKTTKKNKNSHGYGLSIIEEISKKYNGNFVINKNNDECNVVVSLNQTK